MCFAAGHRELYVGRLRKLDVHCRKLLQRMVGPPRPDHGGTFCVSGTSTLFRRVIRCVVEAPCAIWWIDSWHEILPIRNQRVREMVQASHIKTWDENCVSQHWIFARYIMSLRHEGWVRRMLHWQPSDR